MLWSMFQSRIFHCLHFCRLLLIVPTFSVIPATCINPFSTSIRLSERLVKITLLIIIHALPIYCAILFSVHSSLRRGDRTYALRFSNDVYYLRPFVNLLSVFYLFIYSFHFNTPSLVANKQNMIHNTTLTRQ